MQLIQSIVIAIDIHMILNSDPSYYISETCVFAYLGMALFSFNHTFKPAFIIWSIVSSHFLQKKLDFAEYRY